MSVLNRKLRRELLSSKGVLIAIVAIITTGIAGFVAMTTSHANLVRAMESYYARKHMADFWVALKKLPLSEIEPLREIPGITDLQPRIRFPVTADLEGQTQPVSGIVLSLDVHNPRRINDIVLRHGSLFSGERVAEVIVNEEFAAARRLEPGDRIALILNNRRQELTIVGTAISPEFVYLMSPGALVPDPANYGLFYLEQKFAEDVFDLQGACNQLVGLLSPETRERPKRILDEIERRLDEYGVVQTTPRAQQASHTFLSSEIEGLKVMSRVLPTIFLSVAAIILNVLMIRIAQQQRTVIGTLKALGYSNRQLFGHYIRFGLLVGLLGGVMGTGLGYVLSGSMTIVYRRFFSFPQLVNQPLASTTLSAMGIAVAFAVTGTLRGIHLVMKLQPAEAMRPKPPPSAKRVFLERITVLWSRLDFRWQSVLRSIVRQRMRTAAALFAAAVGAALMMVSFHINDSMNAMLDFQFDKVLLSDYDIVFKSEADAGGLLEVRRMPGVDLAEGLFVVAGTLRHEHRYRQMGITGIRPDATLTVPRDRDGRAVPVSAAGLLLTRRLADELQVEPGDELQFEPIRGRRDSVRVFVARVIDSYLGMNAYADQQYLNRIMGERQTVSTVQVRVNPARKTEFFEAVKRLPRIETLSTVSEDKGKIEELVVDQMMAALTVIVAFAGLIFFGSILNSSLIGIAERKTEIATLRVLGYRSREISGMFLRENLLLNVLGGLAGLPLGYWMSLEYDKLIDTDLFRLPFVITPRSWSLPLLFAILFTLLAHLPVQRAVRTLDWKEALNVKE